MSPQRPVSHSDRQSRTPTLKNVAELAGVSVSTTSRALADHPAISESTRKKVQAAAKELGYRPNAQARALRKARTDTIGLAIPSVINPYFAELAEVIQQAASNVGIATILFNSNENADELDRALRVMEDHRVDGIIAVPHEDSAPVFKDLQEKGFPLVIVDRELPGVDVPSVSSDPEPGINAAVRHLLDYGHHTIGYLSGPMGTSTGRQRLDTFISACVTAGIEEQPIYHGGYQQKEGYSGTLELLEKGVDAIIAGDSMMSIGALEALHERKLRVGEDVSLVGFDDYPVMTLQAAPVTVIDQNVPEMGALAFSLLKGLMAGTSPPSITKIPTSLTIRDSTTIRKQPAFATTSKATFKKEGTP